MRTTCISQLVYVGPGLAVEALAIYLFFMMNNVKLVPDVHLSIFQSGEFFSQ